MKLEIIEIVKLITRVIQSKVLRSSGIRSSMKYIHVTDNIRVEIMPNVTLKNRTFVADPMDIKNTFWKMENTANITAKTRPSPV